MKRFKVRIAGYETEVSAKSREEATLKALEAIKNTDFVEATQVSPEPYKDGRPNHVDCVFCMKEHTPEYLPSMKFREDHNLWDRDGLDVINEVLHDKDWIWARSDSCKYLTVRIDMRDGACIIKNKAGNRISPRQLKWQYSESTPDPIKDEEAYKDEDPKTT